MSEGSDLTGLEIVRGKTGAESFYTRDLLALRSRYMMLEVRLKRPSGIAGDETS